MTRTIQDAANGLLADGVEGVARVPAPRARAAAGRYDFQGAYVASLGEVIDPAMPVHTSLVPTIKVEDKSLPFSWDVSVMNILLIAFLLWTLYLLGQPSPRTLTLPEDD